MSQRTKIEKLEELIKETIVGEIIEQEVELLLPPGENFCSVIYKVDFKVKNGNNVETYHAVAKCTPPNQVSQDWSNIQVTIKAEIAWYTTVIPTIQDFQRQHGVKQVADFFQAFYGARINLDPSSDIVDLDSVILTANLGFLGYKNINRHIGFDLKTSKAILRDLATFHAVPIAIKIKDKELFDRNIKPYLPSFTVKDDPSIKDEDRYKDIRAELEAIPEIIPFIDRVITNLHTNRLSLPPATPQEPWGSVCHNDFWINNIMVKETEIPKPVFLDFQTPAYGSIAIDLLALLTVSVAQEVIAKHMDKLIDYYWNEFLKNLKELHIDCALFKYDEFLNQINDAAKSGRFVFAFFYNYMILEDKGFGHIDPTDENFKKEDFKRKKFSLNSRHIEKHRWLILEFVKRGWI